MAFVYLIPLGKAAGTSDIEASEAIQALACMCTRDMHRSPLHGKAPSATVDVDEPDVSDHEEAWACVDSTVKLELHLSKSC